jgi:ABC-type phosphate transport system substrate-binding protein
VLNTIRLPSDMSICPRSPPLLGAVSLLVVTSAVLGVRASAAAPAFEPLNGSGSSWAAPAIDQWSHDIRPSGVVVNFAPNGSRQGRNDFVQDVKDFAVSDVPFLNGRDKVAGGLTETSPYGYSYVPITAGGTAFVYHLTVGGQRVTDLRLTGDTLTKVFTGQITNWADPAITRDYGSQLPSKPIVPVIRSDGSGTTAVFTGWMAAQYGSQWDAFCARYAHVAAPCGPTEFFPSFPGAKAQGSSTAVANYVAASFGEGAIGYDEYAYALSARLPVVKVANTSGFYVAPTASNVAVALTGAQINTDRASRDFLTADLRGVYANPDPRAYPLSSYSYLIVPRTSAKPNPPKWTPGKGAAMSAFADYFLCTGQSKMAGLGYSPLPLNLVQAGFAQIGAMPYAQPTPASRDLANCHNPTFQGGRNVLLETAPQPGPCDRVGVPRRCGFPEPQPADYAPTAADVVGTGARSLERVDGAFARALSAAGQRARGGAAGASHLISWDTSGSASITLHGGARIARPGGSAAAITLLKADRSLDYVRSATGRTGPDSSLAYVPFARDAVTVGTTPLPSGRAAGSFTRADLTAIFSCQATTFGALPDAPAGLLPADAATPIRPVLPSAGGDTRSFFLAAIGVATPGACVQDGRNLFVQEDNGNQPVLTTGVVYPYSVAVALAQTLHGPANGYPADQTIGRLRFPPIDGRSPIAPAGTTYAVNAAFPSYLTHLVFHVVRSASPTDPVPADLKGLFGRQGTGVICTYGDDLVRQQGFAVLPKSVCGVPQ